MAAPQSPNQSDNSASIIWGVAAAFAVIGGIWYAFKTQIIIFYLTIKLYEVKLLSYFFGYHFVPLKDAIVAAMGAPDKITFDHLIIYGEGVGDWLRYPFVILLVILAVIVYLGNSTRVYKHQYTMQDLAKLEQTNWPQISPVVGLDLIKTDIDKGPWAMAMSPMQFCKRLGLLQEMRMERREGMSRRDWNKIEVALKRGEANKIFALQLGALWKGVEQLPPYVQALFAAFAARINADSKAAADLLMQLSASNGKKFNMAEMRALLKKHYNTKLVQEIIQRHAYVLTVMASMLEKARDDGVQASADFLWLKPMDRRLWYTLNTVGRQTPFVEVAGIFAHWIAEKEASAKILVPMVEEATNALELALKEVVYRPEE
jgi:intracellular multiplication protein IcmP